MRTKEVLVEIGMVLAILVGLGFQISAARISSYPDPSPERVELPYIWDDRGHKFYLSGNIGQTIQVCIDNLPPGGGSCFVPGGTYTMGHIIKGATGAGKGE